MVYGPVLRSRAASRLIRLTIDECSQLNQIAPHRLFRPEQHSCTYSRMHHSSVIHASGGDLVCTLFALEYTHPDVHSQLKCAAVATSQKAPEVTMRFQHLRFGARCAFEAKEEATSCCYPKADKVAARSTANTTKCRARVLAWISASKIGIACGSHPGAHTPPGTPREIHWDPGGSFSTCSYKLWLRAAEKPKAIPYPLPLSPVRS